MLLTNYMLTPILSDFAFHTEVFLLFTLLSKCIECLSKNERCPCKNPLEKCLQVVGVEEGTVISMSHTLVVGAGRETLTAKNNCL